MLVKIGTFASQFVTCMKSKRNHYICLTFSSNGISGFVAVQKKRFWLNSTPQSLIV